MTSTKSVSLPLILLIVLLAQYCPKSALAEARNPIGVTAGGHAGQLANLIQIGCIKNGGVTGANLKGTCAENCADREGDQSTVCATFARGDFISCMDQVCEEANKTCLDSNGYRKNETYVDSRTGKKEECPVSGSIELKELIKCFDHLSDELTGLWRGRVTCENRNCTLSDMCGGEELLRFRREVAMAYLADRANVVANDWCRDNLKHFYKGRGRLARWISASPPSTDNLNTHSKDLGKGSTAQSPVRH